jgi:hypothetical protein
MVNPVSRILHDVGLAAWFGGTLSNAVALNTAAAETTSAADAGAVTNAGWDRWTPVNAAAIGLHLVGSVGQLAGNSSRVANQKGVGTMAIVKTATTAAALGVTAYARVLGKKIDKHGAVPVADGTTPTTTTPPEVAAAQSQLKALQWAIPALTGALVVISAVAGEQQRSTAVLSGLVQRITG